MCVQLNSLRCNPCPGDFLKFLFPSFSCGHPLSLFDGYIGHPSLVDSPGAAQKLVVLGLKVFGGDNERHSCTKVCCLVVSVFFCFCSSLFSRAVMVFLRVEGAIPSLFVH